MAKEGKLRVATQSLLDEIEGILSRAADAYPHLDGPARALRRMAKEAGRPLRIGIMGAANSGKSSLANLLVGVPVLPASFLATAGVPALITYATIPSVAAIYESGERVAFSPLQDVAQTVAAIQDCAAMSNLLAGKCVRSGGLKFLEAGLPSDILRSIEILDLPAGSTGLPGFRLDAAIWTTVATRAWRESERAQCAKLPRSVRSRSLLAVTFCDLAADREINLKRLQARLETSAKPYFQGICFVENGDKELAAAASRNKVLFAQIQYLAYQFAAGRFGKAMAIAHRVMAEGAAKAGPAAKSERNGFNGHAVAEAGKDLFDGDRRAALKQPLPEGGLVKPLILFNGHASGAAAKTTARGTAQASLSSAAEGRSKERPRWMTMGAAAAVAGIATLVAIQSGLIGTGNPDSNPLPSVSEAVEQSPQEKTGTRRKAGAEAATAEGGREAQAEAAAPEVRGMAVAEAAAVGERRKAQAEAAAEPKGRRKAEAGRRRSAEAAPRRSAGIGPIMHGISQ